MLNMLHQAGIAEVIGHRVDLLNVIASKGESARLVQNSVATTESGVAQISDILTGNEVDQRSQQSSYAIARVDVFPFEKKRDAGRGQAGETDDSQLKISDRIGVFKIARNNTQKLTFVSSSTLSLGNEHGTAGIPSFSVSDSEFMKRQLDAIAMQQSKVEKKVRGYQTDYEREKDKIEEGIAATSDRIAKIKQEFMILEAEKKELEEQSQIVQAAFTSYAEKYQNAKKAYQEFYEGKIGYVSKLQQTMLSPQKSSAGTFAQIGEDALNVIQDLKRGYARAAVLVESAEQSSPDIRKIEQKEVNYVPELTKYCILYLRKEGIIFYLNIAFEVRWNAKSFSLQVVKDTLFDYEHQRIWLMKKGLASSYDMAQDLPPGFRLPTFEELLELGLAVTNYNEANEEDIFAKLEWVKDEAFFSVDRFVNGENQRMIKGYNFLSKQEDDLTPGSAGYILWVRQR